MINTKKNREMTAFHCGIAAEAFASAMFARLNYDVSVQYGANQPEYDLIVAQKNKLMKVSVKGSQMDGWVLAPRKKGEKLSRYDLIDRWLKKHNKKTIFCFVQFKGKKINDFPNFYLATPSEVAKRMKETSNGKGKGVLYENHTWGKAAKDAKGTTDKIPDSWAFNKKRIEELFRISMTLLLFI
jgi:hypothetical protein